MYDPPAYLWAITIAGPTAVAALTCIVLYGGAERAGLGRRRSALLAGAAAVVLGGWLTASAVIAGHGWYRTLPWFPVAVAGYLVPGSTPRRTRADLSISHGRWVTTTPPASHPGRPGRGRVG